MEVGAMTGIKGDYTEEYKRNAECTVKKVPKKKETNTVEKVSTEKTKSNTKEKNEKVDGKEKKEPTEKQIKSALEQANQQAKLKNTSCEFSYDEDTKRISITVKDKDTDEVIREIPGEETLEMISKMWELAGIMVDDKI